MLTTLSLFILAGLLGASFLNVVIHRGPTIWGLTGGESDAGLSLAAPRSHCPGCRRTLGPLELVPLASFLAQRGRCRGCGGTIPKRYPLVEAAGGIAGALAVLAFFDIATATLALALFLCLIAAAVIDAETGYLPDALTGLALWLGLLASVAGALPPPAAILGAALGYLAFRLIGDAYAGLRGREGLGRGDAKLLAAGGAWLGPFALPLLVLLAALGGLAAVGLRAARGEAVGAGTPLRFGPFLAGATAFLLLARGLAPGLFGRVVPAWPSF
jgi:prepilin signal peptidase PulO-like enzyme (type II secretory pathway)